ncbi:lengsin [Protopterus annectens]|uniref:lengsin n=1 Tax=Protopterus annectens TaxID=7888 RepID=UPI001CF9F8F2|nr:lengsin [Protopterus annectens]
MGLELNINKMKIMNIENDEDFELEEDRIIMRVQVAFESHRDMVSLIQTLRGGASESRILKIMELKASTASSSGSWEASDLDGDEVDGSGMSAVRRKRGVKVTGKYMPPLEWERVPNTYASIPTSQSYIQSQQDYRKPSMGVSLRKPSTIPPGLRQDKNNHKNASDQMHDKATGTDTESTENNSETHEEDGEKSSVTEISKQTLEELKVLLKQSPLITSRIRETGKLENSNTYLQLPKHEDKLTSKQNRTLETFKPQPGSSVLEQVTMQKQKEDKPSSIELKHTVMQPNMHAKVGSTTKQYSPGDSALKGCPEGMSTMKSEKSWHSSHTDGLKYSDIQGDAIQNTVHIISQVEHIKQQISREGIDFIRFEATDLHGVSRSKIIPSRFFQEKSIHGVCMPREYLELTLSPKEDEVDGISAENFNSDVILLPDLSTFCALPWAKKTARVICDSFTVGGNPLVTSPRQVARLQLKQLQNYGFFISSAFTYEFCLFGIPEIINSKTLSFPAATLLNNHSQAFVYQVINDMYHTGGNIESFSSSSGPGQMEITFRSDFGMCAADNAFTFRTGIKELAKKHNFIASFFSETGFYNSGILSHSLWDINGKNNLFCSGHGNHELSDLGQRWLAGLVAHSAALSCLLAPGSSCRKRYHKHSKDHKDSVPVTWGCNDNSCTYNVKHHGGKGTQVENNLGSAMANPYLVLAATIAAGLDGLKKGLKLSDSADNTKLKPFHPFAIPLKLKDALSALQGDSCIRGALGDVFIRYFTAVKQYELETEELDTERNSFLGYFI